MADDRADDDMAADAPGRLPAGTTRTELGAASGTEEAAMGAPSTDRDTGAPVGAPDSSRGETAPGPDQREHKSGSRDPKVFVLLRELSEVHLLLDNLSANPTTTVSELGSDDRLKGQKLPDTWLDDVCKISWPPDGTNEDKAEDAALLIRAKDYLNRLSHPASGSTIAFTLLVTQEDTKRRRHHAGDGEAQAKYMPTRNSLAQTAYPDLIGKAVKFRRYMTWMCVGLVVALVLTCLLSWYVTYGNEALAELRTTRNALNEAESQLMTSAQEGGAVEPANGAVRPNAAPIGVAPRREVSRVATATMGDPLTLYCRSVEPLSPQAQNCAARDRARAQLGRIEARLASWTCWKPFSDCRHEDTKTPFMNDVPSHAAALTTILASAVLPFLYGLLGAGAAIIRSLSRKIRASLLSPRDLHLSFQQLALGAVVGACIGLFVAAPESNATGESLLGPVALSASAISFVAGFGVEAVFQALEALITRIFNVTQAPMGNRGDGIPTN